MARVGKTHRVFGGAVTPDGCEAFLRDRRYLWSSHSVSEVVGRKHVFAVVRDPLEIRVLGPANQPMAPRSSGARPVRARGVHIQVHHREG